MNESSFRYARLQTAEGGWIMVYNGMNGDMLVKCKMIPQADYMDNNLLAIELAKAADRYIVQSLGGKRIAVSEILTLTEVNLTTIGQGRRVLVYKKDWKPVCEIRTYKTPNMVEPFMFECLVAVAMDKYIRTTKRKIKNRGWGDVG